MGRPFEGVKRPFFSVRVSVSGSASNCCGDLAWAGVLGRAADYEGYTGHDRCWGSRGLGPVRIVFYAGATAGSAPIVRGAPQDPYVSNRCRVPVSVSALKSGVIPWRESS